MNENAFNNLVSEIMTLGFSEDQAADYAALIGDSHEVDEQGRVVVRDQSGKELARLALRFFGE